MIVDLIHRCTELGLPYVYLGYYIDQSRKMSYKAKFKPYQIFSDGIGGTSNLNFANFNI